MKKYITKKNVFTIILSALLTLSVVTFYGAAINGNGQVYAANLNDEKEFSTDIYLYQGNPDDNAPFEADNLFPGDSENKGYCVRVSHSDDVEVKFSVKMEDTYKKLAEVMNLRVVIAETGDVLYDGLFKDFPDSVEHKITADNSVESELHYQIDTWLDTKVGNDYQQEKLVADFVWWVEATEVLAPPKTLDKSMIYTWVAITIATFGAIVLLFALRKKAKEGQDAEK